MIVKWGVFLTLTLTFLPSAGIARSLNAQIKVPLSADSIAKAQKNLDLHKQDAKTRDVSFFDTKDLKLFQASLTIRTRQKIDHNKVELTVKLRPINVDEIEKSWYDVDGFKCEYEVLLTKTIGSCSLDSEIEDADLKKLKAKPEKLQDYLSKQQLKFLISHFKSTIAWDKLNYLGPVLSEAWKVDAKNLPDTLDVEQWWLPNRETQMEISMKVPEEDAKETIAKLKTFMKKNELASDENQETKTRWALEFFAK